MNSRGVELLAYPLLYLRTLIIATADESVNMCERCQRRAETVGSRTRRAVECERLSVKKAARATHLGRQACVSQSTRRPSRPTVTNLLHAERVPLWIASSLHWKRWDEMSIWQEIKWVAAASQKSQAASMRTWWGCCAGSSRRVQWRIRPRHLPNRPPSGRGRATSTGPASYNISKRTPAYNTSLP